MKPALSFEAVYGSHNYNLNRPDSDVDMMYYYNPSFEDLYNGKQAEDNIQDGSTDRKHHDVRKLPNLFYKANVNFLEILYSCSVIHYDGLYDLLAAIREEISSMNIPYLYEGCMGMYKRNYRNFQRDSHYVSPEDFKNPELNPIRARKHASSAYRITDFMKRYANQGFKDFAKAIAYDPQLNTDKVFIDSYMAMRDGKYSYVEMCEILKDQETIAEELKGYFKESKVKEDVNRYVIELVEKHVREQLALELTK
ncbi:DNA polymerase beta superfamily protein [Paenibacillus polymyxa]|uniref:Nucleotidyltransferase n=1 Tax=Paenibacillus polymyxa (strain SC2) TaxID=886882 RepID=E3EJV0_PAEPS|nr:nucleotidyltransferase domain-containing protein [Paenibacillus polymyxa]ADO59698.1 hypothetical protein PPSC2_26645 [Paenibacillus polymyxa SC2]WPQ59480.1 nucleotidyltransferase domain-containing protein [Paenibacillus polymyxa]